MKRQIPVSLLSVFLVVVAGSSVRAQSNIFNFDEFGHGNIMLNGNPQGTFGGSLVPDPTGGLPNWNVLMYTLPFQGVQGDVLVQDPAIGGEPILDVLRFDGNSHLIVYSDDLNGFQDPADTPGPPNPFYNNILLTQKIHVSDVFAYAEFTPLVGQPGFDPSNPTYDFFDPGIVPEPGAGTLLLAGVGILGVTRFWRKTASRVAS